MARMVVVQQARQHDDFEIVSINPLPQNELDFGLVRQVVHNFLMHHKRVHIRDIQRTHLGQALVRIDFIRDRDNLVMTSPHQFGGSTFTLVRHNEGRNARTINFNREVWLMLLGFPLDH